MKRSLAVGLIALGAGAAALIALAERRDCDPNTDPNGCPSRRSGSGGGHSWTFSGGGTGDAAGTSGHATSVRGGFGGVGAAHGAGS